MMLLALTLSTVISGATPSLLPDEMRELAELERTRATIFTPPIVLLSVGAGTMVVTIVTATIVNAVSKAMWSLPAWTIVVPVVGLCVLAVGLVVLPFIAIDAARLSERIGRLKARLPPDVRRPEPLPMLELAQF